MLMTVWVCAFPAVSQSPDLNIETEMQTHNNVSKVNGIR